MLFDCHRFLVGEDVLLPKSRSGFLNRDAQRAGNLLWGYAAEVVSHLAVGDLALEPLSAFEAATRAGYAWVAAVDEAAVACQAR